MINEYDKILELTTDSRIELSQSFKQEIGKTLVLGQTRHVCRYGTLSEGHEKLTPSQRYYQAIKEMFFIGDSLIQHRATAMERQADLIDAQEGYERSRGTSKIRWEAKILRAKQSLVMTLTTIEDLMRMLDEYNNIRLELKAQVEAKYPLGIEQAEKDNWEAVAAYRHGKSLVFGPQPMQNIPLSHERKAELALTFNRPDMAAPLYHQELLTTTQPKLELEQKHGNI